MALPAADDRPRVGFEEAFATTDGWKTSNAPDLKSIELKKLPDPPAPQFPAGTPMPNILFTTVCGALNENMHRDDWPDWPKQPFQADTTILKQYDQTVDLDLYHYLVIDLPIRGANVVLALNGVAVPIAYTTGVRAYDLKNRDHANLKGKQKIALSLEYLNTSGSVGFNAIRLVRELTPEEQKALMPAPVEYKKETLTIPPYQNLEALNTRAGRARHAEYEGQSCVYKDAATGATIWKLTDQPGDQHFHAGDNTLGWSPDGRFFEVNGGRNGKNVFDFQTGKWLKTALVASADGVEHPLPDYAARWDSRAHPGTVYGYRVDYNNPPAKVFRFYQFDPATGKETEFAQWSTEAKWAVRELALSTRADSDLAVVGLRESAECCVVDPANADANKRAVGITLKTRLKGLHFGHQDTTLIWHNCYTYEQWERVLSDDNAGDTHLAYYTGGSHAGGGGGFSLNHYEGLTLIRPSDLTDWMAGDQVKIFAHYQHPFESDYGSLTKDGRFWVVNGSAGDVANQILMVNRDDPTKVLRVAGMNTSRNDWSTNTYTLPSPDGTKIAWLSDQLGDGDVYIADMSGRVTLSPNAPTQDKALQPADAPQAPKAEKLPHAVAKLTWQWPIKNPVECVQVYVFDKEVLEAKHIKKPIDWCDNSTVIGAVLRPQTPQFFDWGGKPGTTVVYALVGVNWQGVRSAPVTFEATWPALEKPVTLEINAVDLKDKQDVMEVDRAGEKMLAGNPNAPRDEAHPAYLKIPFTLAVADDYAIWIRYAPGYTAKLDLRATLDQTKGVWRLRCPFRPMSGTLAKPKDGAVKLFSDRLWLGDQNEFALPAGDHTLTLELNETAPEAERHAIAQFWITNDPSFRPPGYDPRADFKK